MNLNEADMQKPEVGAMYKIFEDAPLSSFNVIKVFKVNVSDGRAFYYNLNDEYSKHVWDYVKFPECLSYRLSSLEMELL